MRGTQGRRAMWAAAAVAGMVAAGAADAQEMPRVSPKAKVEQRVGVTDVAVEYHRPGVKGRTVWGELVPFGEPWRTGANERTTVSFSTPVTVGGTRLDAGTYGLVTIPGEEKWTVVLSKDAEAWGAFTYEPDNDAVRVEVTPRRVPHTEWLDFDFENLTPRSADLVVRWAELAVALPFEVDTDRVITGRVINTLAGAADYCADTGGCADAAEAWAKLLTDASPSFWSWRRTARLHHAQGEAAEAAAAARQALAAAEGMENAPPAMYVDELRKWAEAGGGAAEGGGE
ncbi:MAG TPA: DUF2911 domain-containing protein [Thermoanaerobaculia bacterium]